MNGAYNLILSAIVSLTALGFCCMAVSPDCLDRVALRFRARARALRASREAYWTAWGASYVDDARIAKERDEARELFLELSSNKKGRISA